MKLMKREEIEALRATALDWSVDADDAAAWNKLCDQAALLAEMQEVVLDGCV